MKSPGDADAKVLLADVKAAAGRDEYHRDRERADVLFRESNQLLEEVIRRQQDWQRSECDNCFTKTVLNYTLLQLPERAAQVAQDGLKVFPREYALACLAGAALNNLGKHEDALRISEDSIGACAGDSNPELDVPICNEYGEEVYTVRASNLSALLIVKGDSLISLGDKAAALDAYRKAVSLAGEDDSLAEKIRSCQ